jgi:hypothetical protein
MRRITHRHSHALVAGAVGALALLTSACASSGAARGASGAAAAAPGATPSDRARSGANAITAGDLARVSDAPHALAAIERLRPLFLRPRAAMGTARGRQPVVSVFVNGSYAGGLEVLRLLLPGALASARFLQPTEAVTTLGPRYAADGVIMVQLKDVGQ